MKRWIAFAIIVIFGIAALVWSERHPVEVRVSPASILYFIADSEWELSRLPMVATRLSDQEEIDIGNQMASNCFLDSLRDLTGEQKQQAQIVADYVNRVGGKVAAHAHRKLPYRFHFIPNLDFPNAFALPGGHVYVGAGLVGLMDSEDELAAVLGHEIEHIDHYHCAERAQTEARLKKIPLGELVAFPVEIFEAGYGKDQELEADREGTRLAVWASYSPLGAIRMFETFARLFQEYVRHAKSPQEELTQMAIEVLLGYFRSHPLPSERIEQIRKLIAEEHWGGLVQEHDLEVAYIFWTKRAQQAYEAGHYEAATGLAKRSLELHRDQTVALSVLARAQYAQANFPEAAAAFRQALELDKPSIDDDLVVAYGDALAARHTPDVALEEFEDLLGKRPELRPRLTVGVDLAGLTLAARGEQAAKAVLLPKGGTVSALPPEVRGRFGWWFYRAGNFDRAVELLGGAVQERPGDTTLQIQTGWALVEQHNLESAIQRFSSGGNSHVRGHYLKSDRAGQSFAESRIGLAVAEWQAHEPDRALGDFGGGLISQPEWLNPKWVAALYSPGVAKTIEELKAEQRDRHGAQPGGKPMRLHSEVLR
jgi:predicted Zn-dependent protease